MEIEELKQLKQWINWKYIQDKKGKQTKRPYCYKGYATGTDNLHSNDWCDYISANNALKDTNSYFNGIGVVFHNGLCGIDIDHKNINDEIVQDIITMMDTYTEISPSGAGFHLLFTVNIEKIPTYINERGIKKLDNKYYQKNPTTQIECYLDGLTNRFFTFTGNTINDKPICERTEQLLRFLNKYMLKSTPLQDDFENTNSSKTDDEIIDIIRKSKQADKFSKLFDFGDTSIFNDDHSSADESLCCILAYYTQDIKQIDRLFKNSALYRNKWDRADYKQETIKKALMLVKSQTKNINNLSYITANDLQNKDLPPTVYYVDKLIPQGLNLICSVPKMGKSWLALDLCLSICNGTPFLGFQTKEAGCLYLALEDSHNRLKERMNKLLDGKKAPDNLIYSISCEDLQNGFINQIEAFLNTHKEIKVIIIDTLQKIRSESKSNAMYSHDYKELSMIKRLADDRGLCIILIHHLKKGTTTDPFEKVSGTNGLTGTVDSTYVLDKKNRSDEETSLSVVGRDVEYNDYILKFDKDNCKWYMVSTADKYHENYQKDLYNDNTLVDTIKTLVSENNGSWSGTLKSINDKHKELYDYQYASNERKLREDLDKLSPMLMLLDKIKYIPCEKPQGGKRLQKFVTVPCQ